METVQYDYKQIPQRIVAEIKSSRIQVARKITSATMELYWNIGKELSFLHYVSLAFFASVLLMETSCCKRLFVLRLRKKLLINFDAVNGELTSSGIKLLLSIWFSGRY